MPLPQSLVHGRLGTHIKRAFRQKVTIERAVVTQDADTGQQQHTWSALLDHAALPCAVGVTATVGQQRSVLRRSEDAVATETRRVILVDRLLPALTQAFREGTHRHRAVVDGGTAYEITAIDSDSQLAMTRLLVRAVA